MRSILASCALAFTAAAHAGERGSGHLVTEARALRGFTKVELHGSLDAAVREAKDFQVQVTVDGDLQRLVTTEVRGDTLVVRTERGLDPSDGARVEIALPELAAVAANGSGDVSVTGTRRRDLALATNGSGDLSYRGPAAELRVGSTGSGDVDVDVSGDAEGIQVGVKGSGDVTLQGGRARELVAAVAGSGSVGARALTAHGGKLVTSGSGDIDATLDGGEASFVVAGSGDITWHGTAKVANQISSGSGEVIHR